MTAALSLVTEATVPTAALLQAVTDAGRFIPARPPVPVLAGVIIETGPDGTTLSVFDYETSIVVRVDDAPQPPMRGIAHGKLLHDLLKHHDRKGRSTLAIDGTHWHLGQGDLAAAGQLMPADDYPQLPKVEGPWVFEVDGDALAAMVTRAVLAASRDDTLPILTVIRLELEGSTLTAASTDRYRLGVEEIPVARNGRVRLLKDWGAAQVPAEAFKHIVGMLKGERVRVQWTGGTDGVAAFRTDRVTITTRMVWGEFPKYRNLLPTQFTTEAVVDRDLLVKRIKYVAQAAERNTPIRLTLSELDLTLEAGMDTVVTTATVPVKRLVGVPEKIAFNPKFLLDGLSALGPDVKIGLTASTRPGVFTTDDDHNYRYLLMPVRTTEG